MFLKCRQRRKDGKTHRSWTIAESRRYAGNKVAHRQVLYLGEINDSQRVAWERTIAVIDERDGEARGNWRCFRRTARPCRARWTRCRCGSVN